MKERRNIPKETAEHIFRHMLAAGWVKVPPGWRVVPDHPTPEQMKAAEDVLRRSKHPVLFVGDDEGFASAYYAMVTTAPPFKELFAKASP
jgi:acetyl esterase/lipase